MSDLKARIVIGCGESYLVFSVDGVDIAEQRVVQALQVAKGGVFDVTIRGRISGDGELQLKEVQRVG